MIHPAKKREAKNPLLKGPCSILPKEEKKRKNKMIFAFSSNTRRYYLGYKGGKPFFRLEYFDLLPDSLSGAERDMFRKELRNQGEGEIVVYVLEYGEVPETKEEAGKPDPAQSKTCHVSQPRDFVSKGVLPKPQKLKLMQLVEILRNKRILFYTGAGLSKAGGIHTMVQLEEVLGIDMTVQVDAMLKNALARPQRVIDVWKDFARALFERSPTPAHRSLGILAEKLKAQIFTENVDRLHERAGGRVTHLTNHWLKENVRPEWLKVINAVVTVGLSHDDRGFLSWYKKNNLKGRIIAVNLRQPSYLGSEDFILKGDCQKIIPDLERRLAEF